MRGRLLLGLALVAAVVVVPLSASADELVTFPVPTGGFAIGLPSGWVDITKDAPQMLGAAAQDSALKLVAADPVAKGKVYMNVGAARVSPPGGPYTLKQIASANAAELKKELGAKGSVTSTPVKLPAGVAYRLHLEKKGAPNETDEYVLIKDQVEYVMVFVAPTASWKKLEPMFIASARSFRFTAGPDLSKVVLKSSQVGGGYKLSTFPFGTSFIGEATLDLCAQSYPSERLRVGRLQVRYTPASGGIDVSNEVVRYASGGAKQALGEVTAVARACAKKPTVLTQGSVKETYRVSPLKDPKLPAGTVAVKLQITVTKGKQSQTQTGVAIYQVKGDTLSGVYAFVGKKSSFAEAQKLAFHAAEQSAKNLGGTSGGTGFTA